MGSNQSCTVIKQGDWEHHLCWTNPGKAPQGTESQSQLYERTKINKKDMDMGVSSYSKSFYNDNPPVGRSSLQLSELNDCSTTSSIKG